jgi:hypothetical protein
VTRLSISQLDKLLDRGIVQRISKSGRVYHMDGDTTEEDISLPSSTGSSLTGNMSGLASDDVLVVPGEAEKLV